MKKKLRPAKGILVASALAIIVWCIIIWAYRG